MAAKPKLATASAAATASNPKSAASPPPSAASAAAYWGAAAACGSVPPDSRSGAACRTAAHSRTSATGTQGTVPLSATVLGERTPGAVAPPERSPRLQQRSILLHGGELSL